MSPLGANLSVRINNELAADEDPFDLSQKIEHDLSVDDTNINMD